MNGDNECEFDDGRILMQIDGLFDKMRLLEDKIDALTAALRRVEAILTARR